MLLQRSSKKAFLIWTLNADTDLKPRSIAYFEFDFSKILSRSTLSLTNWTRFEIKDRGHKKEDMGEFIEDNHSMGMKMINSDGISHRVKGIMGQFMIPKAYHTAESNSETGEHYVVFQ